MNVRGKYKKREIWERRSMGNLIGYHVVPSLEVMPDRTFKTLSEARKAIDKHTRLRQIVIGKDFRGGSIYQTVTEDLPSGRQWR